MQLFRLRSLQGQWRTVANFNLSRLEMARQVRVGVFTSLITEGAHIDKMARRRVSCTCLKPKEINSSQGRVGFNLLLSNSLGLSCCLMDI